MAKKFIIKMTTENIDDLLYLIEEEVGFEHANIYGSVPELIQRINLIRSGQFPEFIEES